ncbi:hypothetical protein EKK58_07730 [Candidatus Dependentiae bacterium]|nr:MAG: hypothetical protein EKK58_07730 [Candidatus Dependentiae bacterium]
MTKTTSFIRPIIDIPYQLLLNNGFQDSYLGMYSKTQDEWGKSIYFSFKIEMISEYLRKLLLNVPEFVSITIDKNLLIFEFEINTEDYEKIIVPFLDGKYSKVCRDFVKKNFPRVLLNPRRVSNNWKVFNKHEDLKKYWEERIGVEFTEDMEVWSRPEKEDEIYGYPKSDTELAPEAGSISSSGC